MHYCGIILAYKRCKIEHYTTPHFYILSLKPLFLTYNSCGNLEPSHPLHKTSEFQRLKRGCCSQHKQCVVDMCIQKLCIYVRPFVILIGKIYGCDWKGPLYLTTKAQLNIMVYNSHMEEKILNYYMKLLFPPLVVDNLS